MYSKRLILFFLLFGFLCFSQSITKPKVTMLYPVEELISKTIEKNHWQIVKVDFDDTSSTYTVRMGVDKIPISIKFSDYTETVTVITLTANTIYNHILKKEILDKIETISSEPDYAAKHSVMLISNKNPNASFNWTNVVDDTEITTVYTSVNQYCRTKHMSEDNLMNLFFGLKFGMDTLDDIVKGRLKE